MIRRFKNIATGQIWEIDNKDLTDRLSSDKEYKEISEGAIEYQAAQEKLKEEKKVAVKKPVEVRKYTNTVRKEK